MHPDARDWLVVFLCTLALETPVVMTLMRKSEESRLRIFGFIVFANLITHPAVWFVFPANELSYGVQTAMAEIWAYSLEAIFYFMVFRPITFRRAAWIAIAANTFSFGVGLIFYKIVGNQ
jgi:hypothetical protein